MGKSWGKTGSLIVTLMLALSIISPTFAAPLEQTSVAEQPSFVIGGQYAFEPEGIYVIEQMKKEGGNYRTETLPAGRILHVLDFAAYPGVRFVYAETRQGMENAAMLSTLMANLPKGLRPDVVVHSGISGNAGDGNIGDIYLNRLFVIANLATVTPFHTEPRNNEAYDPALGKVVPTIYFPADEDLIELGEKAFETYAATDYFQEIQGLFQTPGQTAEVHTNYIGASSNWFVADSGVIEAWKMLFDIRPKYGTIDFPGEKYYSKIRKNLKLGTVDMETAAAAKVFYEHGIPFAAARYPSDSARESAREEIEIYREKVADLGGGFMWQWVKTIAAHAEQFRDADAEQSGFDSGSAKVFGSALFQYSTITALKRGDLAGQLTLGELKKHGDLGVGTLNGLDGEMIIVDGVFYRADTSGKLHVLDNGQKTPYAAVVDFKPQFTLKVEQGLDMARLSDWINARLPDRNGFYAVKLDGTFQLLHGRSVPKQEPPYPTLEEVIQLQSEFEFADQKATLVGFITPEYASGLNAAGLHLHFVTEDRVYGGHLLNVVTGDATVEIMPIEELNLKTIAGQAESIGKAALIVPKKIGDNPYFKQMADGTLLEDIRH